MSVAKGWVSFSLGTDTAGSGRVPAAFNSLVGLKPTRGRLSTRGVVPACRSLDCVTVLTRTVTDAVLVMHSMGGFVGVRFLVENPEVVAQRLRGAMLVATFAGDVNRDIFSILSTGGCRHGSVRMIEFQGCQCQGHMDRSLSSPGLER